MSGKEIIPPRSFGHCRWCGAESVRLQYLMCPDCFRISELIPSKTSVLLNRPDVRKRIAGTTVKAITPELRKFLLDPNSRFPPERSYQQHWNIIQEQAISLVSDSDVKKLANEMLEEMEEDEIPDSDELETIVGVETVLRFMLHVAVLRGTLKLDDEDLDGSCIVCGKPTIEGTRGLCSACRGELIREVPDVEKQAPPAEKPYAGMKSRDIILGKRGF